MLLTLLAQEKLQESSFVSLLAHTSSPFSKTTEKIHRERHADGEYEHDDSSVLAEPIKHEYEETDSEMTNRIH